MNNEQLKKPLVYRVWFKLVLIALVMLPAMSEIHYDPQDTSLVIFQVLSSPYITQFEWLMPITKLILGLVIFSQFFLKEAGSKVLLAYYGIILLIIGIGQNLAMTQEYGWVLITGNLLIEYAVIAFVFFDLFKGLTKYMKHDLDPKRLWVLIPMLLAFVEPYVIKNEQIVFGLNNILTNDTGVTYCMITPLVIGILLIFIKGVHLPTLHIISFVGLYFGIVNMLTWFVFNPINWWMGVLHLPLLILSIYGLIGSSWEKHKTRLETNS